VFLRKLARERRGAEWSPKEKNPWGEFTRMKTPQSGVAPLGPAILCLILTTGYQKPSKIHGVSCCLPGKNCTVLFSF